MKNIFSRIKKKKNRMEADEDLDDEEFPERIPYRVGTVINCEPSPTAEGKPEEEKVYITTLEIDGSTFTAAQQLRCEKGQQVVATTVGNIALIFPEETKALNSEKE